MRRIEFLGLDQHFFPHSHFTEVVQQRGVAELAHLLASEVQVTVRTGIGAVHGLGQRHGQVGHAEGVPRGRRIARLDGRHRSLDEALEQVLNGLVEQAVLQRHRRLAGQRLRNRLLMARERHYLRRRCGYGIEPRLALALAVDQLHHSHHFAALVLHGNGQDRLAAIAGLLVELPVEGVGHAGRQVICVFEVHTLAGLGNVAGNGTLVHFEQRLAKFQRYRIVLRQLEAQTAAHMLAALAPLGRKLAGDGFSQIQRAGIGAGDLAHFGQDHLQQGTGVVFGGERRPDLVQLLDLVRRQRQPLAQLLTAIEQVHVLERVAHHAFHQFQGSVCRKVSIDERVDARIGEATIRQRDDADVGSAQQIGRVRHQQFGGGDHHSLGTARQPAAISRTAVQALQFYPAESVHPGRGLLRDAVRREIDHYRLRQRLRMRFGKRRRFGLGRSSHGN